MTNQTPNDPTSASARAAYLASNEGKASLLLREKAEADPAFLETMRDSLAQEEYEAWGNLSGADLWDVVRNGYRGANSVSAEDLAEHFVDIAREEHELDETCEPGVWLEYAIATIAAITDRAE